MAVEQKELFSFQRIEQVNLVDLPDPVNSDEAAEETTEVCLMQGGQYSEEIDDQTGANTQRGILRNFFLKHGLTYS